VHLDDAKASLTRLYTALRGREVSTHEIDWNHPQAARFKTAMDDDFNTSEAVAVLFDLANEVNKSGSADLADLLFNLAGVMGLLQRNADDFLHGETNMSLDVDALIAARLQAKKNKDFALADAIRKQLQEANIILEDTPQGTTWRST
jgi:cysteinyl-tRNA synthetase